MTQISKKIFISIVLLMSTSWELTVLFGEEPDVSVSEKIAHGINVRDFGAKGDGVTDDTQAIQNAINFVMNHRVNVLLARQPMLDGAPELGNLPALGTTGEFIIAPEIYFPAGTYRLTQTLVMQRGTCVIRGENGAVLRQEHSDVDLLYFDWGFRVQIRNITFEGGRRQVSIYTGNNDTANITLEHCRFVNSNSEAVWSYNFYRPGGTDFSNRSMGAYDVKFVDGKPQLTPNDESGKKEPNSTNFTITDCDFVNCRRAVNFGADGALIEKCRIQVSGDTKYAVMILGGRVILKNITAVAAASDNRRWWIEQNNGGKTVVVDSQFSVEGSRGMPLIRIEKRPYGPSPITVILRNIDVKCGGDSNAALMVIGHPTLFLSQTDSQTPNYWNPRDNTPNLIDISDVRETSGKPVAAIFWETKPTREILTACQYDNEPAVKKLGGEWTTHFPFRISLQNNHGLDETLPPVFANDIAKPLPASVLEKVSVNPVAIDSEAMFNGFTRRLRAVDFGVDTDINSDDTEGMKRVLNEAASGTPAVIELPPVMITISEALKLPPEIAFIAPGLATLKQKDITQPIFYGTEQRQLWVRNLRLASGAYGFKINTPLQSQADILIETCFFYQQLESSLSFLAGDGSESEANANRLLLRNCTFISPIHGVVTNAANSEIHNFWVSTNARMDRSAFITNLGGNMRISNMLGVPMPMTDHKLNHLPVIPNWKFSNDIRWFDNYGKMDIRYTRFGGEYYGIPSVYNFTDTGTVAFDGCFTYFSTPRSQQCLLYYVKNPQITLLRNAGFNFRWTDETTCKRPDSNINPPKVYIRNFLSETASMNVVE